MENQQPSIPLTFLVQNSVKNYEWGSTDPKCYVSELSK